MKATLLALALTITAGFAQTADYSKTPKDKAASVTDALEKAIQPYVTQGRRTYPAAKKRFIAGLPPKYIFSVTTKFTTIRTRHSKSYLLAWTASRTVA